MIKGQDHGIFKALWTENSEKDKDDEKAFMTSKKFEKLSELVENLGYPGTEDEYMLKIFKNYVNKKFSKDSTVNKDRISQEDFYTIMDTNFREMRTHFVTLKFIYRKHSTDFDFSVPLDSKYVLNFLPKPEPELLRKARAHFFLPWKGNDPENNAETEVRCEEITEDLLVYPLAKQSLDIIHKQERPNSYYVCKLMYEVAKGLDYIHGKGYVRGRILMKEFVKMVSIALILISIYTYDISK
jgi:hypothetical protein